MEFVYVVITILLAIVISDILSKIFKSIPSIFFQILIGILISYLPFFRGVELDVEIIMLIIIKPLIFSEAQKLSFEQLKKCYRPIFSLSVALVIVTVIITGSLVNLIFPRIPIALTIILIAMIIPTNVTILESISKNLKFPHGILHILEGESLFNECIAILIFDLALSAIETNEFHIKGIIYEFISSLAGGLFVGIVLGTLIVMIRAWLERKDFESPAMMVSIQIMTPFIVYIVAAKGFHVSGILAVIVTGMIHGLEKPMLNLKSTKLQVISDSTWDVIHYLLDGIIAIYLGLSLRTVVSSFEHGDVYFILGLILISVVAYCIIIGLRFLWVVLQPVKFKIDGQGKNELMKGGLIYALSSVHGTITLLIALSIPIMHDNEMMLLLRQELIFIVSIVIVMSIIIPAIVFQIILPKKNQKDTLDIFEEVKREMIYYTIFELERIYGKKDENLITVTDILRNQLTVLDKTYFRQIDRDEVEEILEKAKEIEIKAINELIQEQKISKNNGMFYQRYIMHVNKNSLMAMFVDLRMSHIRRKIEKSLESEVHPECVLEYKIIEEFRQAKAYTCKAVLEYLNEQVTNENYETINFVKEYYKKKNRNDINGLTTDHNKQVVKRYLSKAFQIQHIFLQDHIENGLISSSLGDELMESLSYDEMIYYRSLN